jgi:hypothetical protein
MANYAGFKTVLRLMSQNQSTVFLYDQMGKDYHVEGVKDPSVNWRPRKPYLDSDYIDINHASFVDFEEVLDVYTLILGQLERMKAGQGQLAEVIC